MESLGKLKKIFRTIAFILVFILVIEIIPVQAVDALRETLTNNVDESYDDLPYYPEDGIPGDIAGDEENPAYILGEDASMRDAYTKYFRMSDGSYSVAYYEDAVHYLDENDTWQDIDNRLSEDNADNLGDGFTGSENKSSNVKIKFANKSNSAYLYRLKVDQYSIYVGADKKGSVVPNKVDAVIRQNDDSEEETDITGKTIEDVSFLKNNMSEVTYPDIWDNTDLQYIISGTSVKENILIKEASKSGSDSYTFDFTLKLNKLEAELQESGSVYLYDSKTGEVIYQIPVPYMYDASGASSALVTYTLEKQNNGGKYRLTITADSSWIEDEERVFPVTIDPILAEFGLANEVRDTFIKQGSPNEISAYAADILYIGYDTLKTELNRRVYTKFNSLPELPTSAIVTEAVLFYYQMPAYSPGYSGTDGLTVVAREVIESWDSSTITWNNKPNNWGNALDYVITGKSTNDKYLSWDITSLVQSWYAGKDNNGVVLMADTEPASRNEDMNVRLASSDTKNLEYIPQLVLRYRDSKGLEDYWTYESFSMGELGTAYVNVFNRNLTFVYDLYNTPGGVLPLGISAVYNSSLAGKLYSPNNNSVNKDKTLWAGKGNKLNVYEKIYEKKILNKTYIVHEDADGTEHYYLDDNGKYVSEDGLDYTITKSGSTYKMTNSDGIIKEFNSIGNLSKITDKYGNGKIFYYSSEGYITKITEKNKGATSEKTVASFSDSGGYLSCVSGSAAGTDFCYLWYTDGKLTSILCYSMATGISTIRNFYSMQYDTNSNRLTSITSSEDKLKLEFTYDSKGKVLEVTKSIDGVCINKVGFSDGGDKTVKVQSWGQDEIYNNNDDLYTVYSCDNYGRVISSYVKDYYGNVLGAAAATYNNAEGTKKHNTVAESAIKDTTSENLLNNSSFEDTLSANPFTDFTAFRNWMSVTSDQAYLGMKSLKLHFDDISAGIALIPLTLTAGNTYCFSLYFKTDDNAYGNFSLSFSGDSGTISETYVSLDEGDSTIDNGWRRAYITAEITKSDDYTLYMMFVGSGSVYIDCVQLEKASAPGRYNMMEWTSFGNGMYYISSTYLPGGYSEYLPKAWVMTGGPITPSFFYQNVNVNRPGTDTYMLSFFAVSNSVRLGTDTTRSVNRVFEVYAEIHYTDGTYDSKKQEINPQNREMQYVTLPIIPDASKDVEFIRIGGTYNCNANTSYLGDFSLTLEPAQAYEYDKDGNVKSIKTPTGGSMLEYADDNKLNLKSIEKENGDKYIYEYWESPEGVRADIKSVENKNNVLIAYKYDDYGNIKSVSAQNTRLGGSFTSKSFEYGDNGNYLESQKDAKGNVTQYFYNYNNGLINKIINAEGKATAYLYNSIGQNDTVFSDENNNGLLDANEMFVKYGYNAFRLTSIDKGNLKYSFVYDKIGNMSSVSIDGSATPLATYSYSTAGGYLTKQTYGNGDYVEYSYDKLGRLVGVRNNGVKSVEYVYNNNGDVYCIKDYEKGIIQNAEYDSLGRLIRMYESDISTSGNGSASFAVENKYDSIGRAEKTTYKYDGIYRTYSLLYKANSDLIKSITMPNGEAVSYDYDHLERIRNTEIKNKNNELLSSATYKYAQGALAYTTSSDVEKVTLDVTGSEYEYAYDKVGNITEIKKNGQVIRRYTYDSLNQMTSEAIIGYGESIGYKTIYTYDLYGNIVSKDLRTYSAVMNYPEFEMYDINYTYGSDNWGDLLTSDGIYNYTYDEIGNLISKKLVGQSERGAAYYNWTNGRRLASIVSGSDVYEYKYNKDGIRTEKTVSGETITYIVDGSTILKQIGNGKTIEFYYDANGVAVGFGYNGLDYYYGKNLQGDVIELYQAGQLIATYDYDAWGKLLSIRDVNGNEIVDSITSTNVASINPIRYRGYYYDVEGGLYYLNSRYYNPEIGRWINADSYASTGQGLLGYNMYAYCNNNPVMYNDKTGNIPRMVSLAFADTGKQKGNWEAFVKKPSYNLSNIPDRTEEASLTVRNNMLKMKALSVTPGTGLCEFVDLVKPGGEWDYKVKGRYPDWMPEDGVFMFQGEVMTAEQFGNFNYGSTGTAFGFSPQVIYAGGGSVAIYTNGIKWDDVLYFFDSKEDHESISQGIAFYYEERNKRIFDVFDPLGFFH